MNSALIRSSYRDGALLRRESVYTLAFCTFEKLNMKLHSKYRLLRSFSDAVDCWQLGNCLVRAKDPHPNRINAAHASCGNMATTLFLADRNGNLHAE